MSKRKQVIVGATLVEQPRVADDLAEHTCLDDLKKRARAGTAIGHNARRAHPLKRND